MAENGSSPINNIARQRAATLHNNSNFLQNNNLNSNSNTGVTKPSKFHEKKNSISEESKVNIQIP